MSQPTRRPQSRADRRREDRGSPPGSERRSGEIPPVLIHFHTEPEGIVVALVNCLVVSNCFPIRDRLETYARNFTAPRIAVDLSGVPYADTAGLGMLAEMRAACHRLGKELILRKPTPRVREILEALQLDRKLLIEE